MKLLLLMSIIFFLFISKIVASDYESVEINIDGSVSGDECANSHEYCEFWATHGECENNPTYMLTNCRKACNSCNKIIAESINNDNDNNDCANGYHNCTSCENLNSYCDEYAKLGNCDSHPGWMIINCAKTCKYCHMHDYYTRCKRFYQSSPSLDNENGVNKFFTKIVDFYKENEKNLKYQLTILKNDPWILQFDNLLNEKEALGVIKAKGLNFERSTDVGQRDNTGHFQKVTSSSRTSSNAWCQETCMQEPIIMEISNRIVNITGLPFTNSENYQVLQYHVGEYYKAHHDFIASQIHMSCGPRILTFFLYLSDVEEGGETAFPKLGLAVKPKIGRAILWPSVSNESPLKIDSRTTHEARPVIKGVKYGANVWYHQYDFQTPNLWSCTG